MYIFLNFKIIFNLLIIMRNAVFAFIVFLFLASCKNKDEMNPIVNQTEIAFTLDQDNKLEILSEFERFEDAYVLPWSQLLNLQFEEIFVDSLGIEAELPIFNDTLKALDGQMVLIEGFFIPVSETGDENIVILSAYPYAQCFFCGKAGIESIIDVIKPQNLPSIKLDDKIKLKGRLELNHHNFDYLVYILNDAVYIK